MNQTIWYQAPQWWAIIVALLLGVIGIFQDWIRSWFKKPKLKISISLSPPDCHKVSMTNSSTGQFICDCYYFRFKVENEGNYYAEDVEVMATELHKKEPNGQYKKVEGFLPLNLVWAHYGYITIPKIQPNLFKHCDFGHILKSNFANLNYYNINSTSNIVFQLDTAVAPNTGSHILLPGDYNIKIIIAANNVKPHPTIYNLVISDMWTDNERDMLEKYISIK